MQNYAAERSAPIVLDLTAADVPAIASLLTTGTDDQRFFAAKALGYGGGDAAIAALRANPEATHSAGIMLGIAMAQRGSAADLAELMDAIDAGGRLRWSRTDIVLTLGAQRVRAAIPILERLARKQGGGASDARTALAWIQREPADVRAVPAATDEDQVIAAVLRVGLPFAENGAVFDDDTRGGAWILDADAWRFRPGARGGRGVSVHFTTGFNRGRNRAVVNVAYRCGDLCGTGHDYLLTREADGWHVRAVNFIWIS